MNASNIKNKTGKRIRQLRQSRGLNQKELAYMLKCDASNICKLETGKSFPGAETLALLCKALNYSPKDFFDF